MSSLVLKICSEYAKAMGLNFPPCVQQEINAIAQWVGIHAARDLKITQDGNVITFVFNQGGENTFTLTLPDEYTLNVDDLEKFIKGSSTIVVDKSEDGKTLVVRLDKSQETYSLTLNSSRQKLTDEQYNNLVANLYNNTIVYGGQTFKLKNKTTTDLTYGTFASEMENGVATPEIKVDISTKIADYYGYSYTPTIPELQTYVHFIHIEDTNTKNAVYFMFSSHLDTEWTQDNIFDFYDGQEIPVSAHINGQVGSLNAIFDAGDLRLKGAISGESTVGTSINITFNGDDISVYDTVKAIEY